MDKCDLHIHTEFSYDSKILSNSLIERAIELDYKTIAITEHLDLLPQELGYFGLKSLSKYRAHISILQDRYKEIEILCGLEIGDYHQVIDFALPLISQFDFDIILGSVHFLSDRTNVAVPIKQNISRDDILDYYTQNLNLVQNCDIDVLAHLGVYKRYLSSRPEESIADNIIRRIFQEMIDREIALEINFSGFRKPMKSLMPDQEQLDLYYDLGGRLITIGSDSHALEHFDDYYHKVMQVDAIDRFQIHIPRNKLQSHRS